MTQRTTLSIAIAAALCTVASVPVNAQLNPRLPGDTLGRVHDTLGDVTSNAAEPIETAMRDATSLARNQLRRLDELVSRNRDSVEWDDQHQPAVRGEILLLDPDSVAIDTARQQGYTVLEQGALEGLDIRYARLGVPTGMPLAKAIQTLRKALPGKEVTADQLHFQAGGVTGKARAAPPSPPLPRGGTVGVIDGGIAGSKRLVGQRGFVAGAPKPSDHASAIASLLTGAGTERIYGADVYGTDPAGGNALAIARALGWMQVQGVPVVSISLVGPANPLLARAISAAQARNVMIVAAVGNNGAAAPPAYPASYPGVIAVTGIDGKGRVLIEAGRATHLDYAAPGADLWAIVPGKGRISLRGTSYAAPLAAARIAARRAASASASSALKATDSEAVHLTSRVGRGVLCGSCRSGG